MVGKAMAQPCPAHLRVGVLGNVAHLWQAAIAMGPEPDGEARAELCHWDVPHLGQHVHWIVASWTQGDALQCSC